MIGDGLGEFLIVNTWATVLAAALVRPANLNARVTVIGFVIIIAACIVWIDAAIESKASLVIQNVILLFINVIGVWRWYPRAEKEAKG